MKRLYLCRDKTCIKSFNPWSVTIWKGRIPKSKIPATGSRRILQEWSGKITGSCRKAPEIAGSGSSIPTGNFLNFFRRISFKLLCFPAGIVRKSSKKIRKISFGNTASTFRQFPVLSCRNRPVLFDLG